MEYMTVFKEPQSDFDRRHDDAYWGAWGAYIAALQQSGISKGGNGLQPPHTASQVRVRDGQRHVQDGPYPDTKEHLGGYFVIDVPSFDQALEWAARAPCASSGSVEVRPVLPPMQAPQACEPLDEQGGGRGGCARSLRSPGRLPGLAMERPGSRRRCIGRRHAQGVGTLAPRLCASAA